MNRPFFSVVIPAYNVASYLAETLESVYNQTWSDYEIIVVNDGSVDDTQQILDAQTDSRLRVIQQPNAGAAHARNRGIREAVGEYVAFLDGDDLWFPEHLELAAKCLRAEGDAAWYAARHVSGASADAAKNSPDREISAQCRMENYFTFSQRKYFVWTGGLIMRRELLPENLFPEGITHGEDIIAWVRMAARHPLIALNPAITAFYRQRPGSAMRTSIDLTDKVKQDVAILDCLQESFSGRSCPPAVCRHLSRLSWSFWMNRIMSSHWKSWLPLIWRRRRSTGWFFTLWLCLFAWTSVAMAVFFAIPFRIMYFLKFTVFRKG